MSASKILLAASLLAAPGVAEVCNYPGGDCYELRMQKCKEGSTTETFTLHGLWPQWGNTCGGAAFDMDLLAPIMSEMEAKWMSCPEDGGHNAKFWAHEWTKHGTCTGMDQLTYFKKGLSLYGDHMTQDCSGAKTDQCTICFTKGFDQEETCSDDPNGKETLTSVVHV